MEENEKMKVESEYLGNNTKKVNGKNKNITVVLIVVILILVLGIGVCAGILLAKGDTNIFNITEQKEQNNETKAVAVTAEAKQIDEKYMIIEGKDSSNNTVWTYQTVESKPEQLVNENQKLMTIKDGKIYLCDWGKLYILDLATGNVLYKNTDCNIGSGTACTFDENNNLYVIAYLANLQVFDEEANCIEIVRNIEAAYSMDQQMLIENNELIIKYNFPQGNEAKTYDSDIINLNDLFDNSDKISPKEISITNQLGFEELEKVKIDSNGNVSLVFKESSELYNIYQKGNSGYKVNENVKSIDVLSVGNSGSADLVMIKLNGTVEIISSEKISNEKIVLEKLDISNVDFIIKHFGGSAWSYSIVKKDGDASLNKENLKVVHTENLIGINNQTENKESAYADEYVKIIDQVISENENVNRIKCDLIYFNEDDIPDLVIDLDCFIKVYMYENGTVYNPINESYGTGGCKGYDYYEKRGVISSFGTSLAGATCGESFYILNSKKEMEYTFSYTVKGAEPEDEEMKKQMEEELNKYGGYYYKGQKITEEEFKSKLKEYGIEFSIETNSPIKKALTGTKSLSDLKKQLGK